MAARLVEIEAIYRTRYQAFLRVATAILGEEQLGQDAVHDAFVRAVEHRRKWRGDAPLEVWVWRIVVNAARRRGARELTQVPAEKIGLEPAQNGAVDPVRALVAALPERQRLVLFLRYYADLDYHSIAAALGIKPGTVGATLNAAHSALRAHLQEVPG